MTPPIIAYGLGNFNVFHSVEDMFSFLEVGDMLRGGYDFYDSDGQCIKITVSEEKRWLKSKKFHIVAELETQEPVNKLLLRVEIVEYFMRHPEYGLAHEKTFSLSLKELTKELVRCIGFSI